MTRSRLPSITAREVVQKLRRAGYTMARQKGSHAILIRESDRRAVVVPMHVKRDLPKGTLHRIIQMAGLTVEKFSEL